VVSGTGCPIGSVSATVAPDGSTISIIFDKFQIAAHNGANPLSDLTRTCRFIIPTSISPGYILEGTRVDYRGFSQVTMGARAFLTTTGPNLTFGRFTVANPATRSEVSNAGSDFTLTHQIIPAAYFNNCQVVRPVEFTTELKLMSPFPRAPQAFSGDSSVMLDSADISSGGGPIQVAVRIRKCQ
jgi:hypothetical protein